MKFPKFNEYLITESSEVVTSDDFVSINPEDFKKVKNILKSFGVDAEEVLLKEELQDEASKTSVGRKLVELNIPKSVIRKTEEYIKLGNIASNWYEETSRDVFDELGESDGCLFLICLAICSQNTAIEKNFLEAIKLFRAIKYDIKKNRALLDQFIEDKAFSFNTDRVMQTEPYSALMIFYQAIMIPPKMLPILGKMGNTKRMLKMYKDSDYTFNRTETLQLFNNMLDKSGKIFKLASDSVQAHKIFNFCINLLDPNNDIVFNGKFKNVTIDTWMIRFFYPETTKNSAGGFFSNVNNIYYKLTEIINDLSDIFKTTPSQLQAIIWIGIKREYDIADATQRRFKREWNKGKDLFNSDLRTDIQNAETTKYDSKFETDYESYSNMIRRMKKILMDEISEVKATNIKLIDVIMSDDIIEKYYNLYKSETNDIRRAFNNKNKGGEQLNLF